MIGDTVVGTVECVDGARFRVEVNGSLAHDDYYCVVWVMDATNGVVAYACHMFADGTAITTIRDNQPTRHSRMEVAEFLQWVDSAHGFRQWQPALL